MLAIEVQDLVQTKVGISKFTTVYSQIRQGAEDVRRERRVSQGIKVEMNLTTEFRISLTFHRFRQLWIRLLLLVVERRRLL